MSNEKPSNRPSSGGDDRALHPHTRAVYSPAQRQHYFGSVVTPIFQGALFRQRLGASYDETVYPRLSTLPNHQVLGDKLARLEGAEEALVTASGMAAISTTLLTLLGSGDHALLTSNLYAGTDSLVTEDFRRYGISYDFVDGNDPESWTRCVRDTTRVFYTESVSNPLLQVPQLEAVTAFAKRHGCLSIVDATFSTPVNYRPLAQGFDLVLHSATKYLNGHSDLAAGVIAGRSELLQDIRHHLNHFGGCLDPHACYLFERGLKTLFLRVARQNESAMRLATFLEQRPEVRRAIYPGLPSHPQHEQAKCLFDGFGGMVCFELAGGLAAARQLGQYTTLIAESPSLGGVDSNITVPGDTVHQSLSDEDKARAGLIPGLLRMSVGIEAVEDLEADLDQALRQVAQAL